MIVCCRFRCLFCCRYRLPLLLLPLPLTAAAACCGHPGSAAAVVVVQVDVAARTAAVGPCVSGRELRAATAPAGLHFPGPHLSEVGLSGFILGEGVKGDCEGLSGLWGPARDCEGLWG